MEVRLETWSDGLILSRASPADRHWMLSITALHNPYLFNYYQPNSCSVPPAPSFPCVRRPPEHIARLVTLVVTGQHRIRTPPWLNSV